MTTNAKRIIGIPISVWGLILQGTCTCAHRTTKKNPEPLCSSPTPSFQDFDLATQPTASPTGSISQGWQSPLFLSCFTIGGLTSTFQFHLHHHSWHCEFSQVTQTVPQVKLGGLFLITQGTIQILNLAVVQMHPREIWFLQQWLVWCQDCPSLGRQGQQKKQWWLHNSREGWDTQNWNEQNVKEIANWHQKTVPNWKDMRVNLQSTWWGATLGNQTSPDGIVHQENHFVGVPFSAIRSCADCGKNEGCHCLPSSHCMLFKELQQLVWPAIQCSKPSLCNLQDCNKHATALRFLNAMNRVQVVLLQDAVHFISQCPDRPILSSFRILSSSPPCSMNAKSNLTKSVTQKTLREWSHSQACAIGCFCHWQLSSIGDYSNSRCTSTP